MISSAEALEKILAFCPASMKTEISMQESLGRVLAKDVVSDRDFPPYNRVAMDGIAILFTDYENGTRQFQKIGFQPAGMPPLSLSGSAKCMEIATGSVLSIGADTIVPYEHLKWNGEVVTIMEQVRKGQNIHYKGVDRKKHETLIEKGCRIGSPEIAVLASVGLARVQVGTLPEIAILSTGDELVRVEQTPQEYQVRRSNVHCIHSELVKENIWAKEDHLPDNQEILEAQLEKYLDSHDILILSGGVSKGKKDFIPSVLERIGVEKVFHKVAQRPGKPMFFGARGKKVVFGLPGNPISAYVCYLKYVRPYIHKFCGMKMKALPALRLGEDVVFKPGLTKFQQVRRIITGDGEYLGMPVYGKGSGDIPSLLLGTGFIELPATSEVFKKGDSFPFIEYS